MTVILRLQGLDVKAGTEDIRTFFEGLHIPGGGVYIVGGSLREAFIAFTTQRDAQLALRHTDNFLKGSKVTLQVSCMAELEQKLKLRLKRKKPSPTLHPVKRTQPLPDANKPPLNSQSPPFKSQPNTPDANETPLNAHHPLPFNPANMPQPLNLDIANIPPLDAHSLDSSTAFLLGICTAIQGLQSSLQSGNKDAASGVGDAATDEDGTPKQTLDPRPGYVRLFGLPASTTKELICSFFEGLTVQEVIINVELGRSHVCLVKFTNTQDACDALLFNQKSLGSICVEVRGATEKMWTSALQECEPACDVGGRVKLKQIPGGTANKQNVSAPRLKRPSVHQMPFKPAKKPRYDSDSKTDSPPKEYVIKVNNLPKNMTKTDIKELFGCPNIAHTNVQHLLDEEGLRTKTSFLIFNSAADYEYAMNLSGCHVGSDAITVSSITRKIMWDLMAQNRHGSLKQCQNRESNPAQSPSMKPAAQTCLFVRNMPANVQKSHINRLFCKYKVRMDDITVLHDSDGRGIGEALIQFKSQKLAALAQRLHGVDFMGTEVLLTRINATQMKDILAKCVWGS